MSENALWTNVLLTDAGFFNPFHLRQPLTALINRLKSIVQKPFGEARVLFIPTAACDDEAKTIAEILYSELLVMGFKEENITIYNLDGTLSEAAVMSYDIMYLTGGWCQHLLEIVHKTKFDSIIKKFVFANKVYIGMSAGSVIATPNIMGCFGEPDRQDTEGLGLIQAYIDCHCNMKPDPQEKKLPLPHIMLSSHQAVAVSHSGYELIEETSARHEVEWSNPPIVGVNVFVKQELFGI